MSFNHLNINQLTNLKANYYLGVEEKVLNMIAHKWNSIPRKSLNYQTPNEVIKKATRFKSLLPVA